MHECKKCIIPAKPRRAPFPGPARVRGYNRRSSTTLRRTLSHDTCRRATPLPETAFRCAPGRHARPACWRCWPAASASPPPAPDDRQAPGRCGAPRSDVVVSRTGRHAQRVRSRRAHAVRRGTQARAEGRRGRQRGGAARDGGHRRSPRRRGRPVSAAAVDPEGGCGAPGSASRGVDERLLRGRARADLRQGRIQAQGVAGSRRGGSRLRRGDRHRRAIAIGPRRAPRSGVEARVRSRPPRR